MRRIEGNIYRITDKLSGRVWFVECRNEMELIEYIASELFGTPVSVVFMSPYGKTPTVAVYTNVQYKDIVKKRYKK